MTRWKNEDSNLTKTDLVAAAWERKSGTAGFSGGVLIMQNGVGNGDMVTSSSESPSSTVSSTHVNGTSGITNGSYQDDLKGNGDNYTFSDENEPCSSTVPGRYSFYQSQTLKERRQQEEAEQSASSTLSPGSTTPTATDFIKERPSKVAIALGPPPIKLLTVFVLLYLTTLNVNKLLISNSISRSSSWW